MFDPSVTLLMPFLVCEFCGKEFQAKNTDRKYCSKRCGSMDTRESRSEQLEGRTWQKKVIR